MVLHKYTYRVINDLGKKDVRKSDRRSMEIIFFLKLKDIRVLV